MKKSFKIILCAIIAAAILGSCSKKKDDPAPANYTTFYFDGTFDNVAYNQKTTPSATAINNGIGSSSTGNYVDYANSDDYVYEFWEGSYWSKITYNGSQVTEVDALVIRVHKSFYYVGADVPSTQDIKDIYAVGNYTNFTTVPTNYDYPTTEGWDIELTDNNGEVWTSYRGTANQSGSFIKIDTQNDVNLGGTKFLSAKGSLSCKLYDQNGNVKVLKGAFYQIFSDYSVNY